MDDLNGDGLSDIRDAEVLYWLVEDAAARPEAQGLSGAQQVPSTAAHGPLSTSTFGTATRGGEGVLIPFRNGSG